MSRGIFQGYPISPFLFLFAIEILAISIRGNENIKGIMVGDMFKKINLLADDAISFLLGDLHKCRIFSGTFSTLHVFLL